MLKIDDRDKVLKMIIKDRNFNEFNEREVSRASNLLFSLENEVHEDLYPVIEAWINGNRIGFEFKGITLDEIMEKEGVSYLRAIFSMDFLMNDPDAVANYKSIGFFRDNIKFK